VTPTKMQVAGCEHQPDECADCHCYADCVAPEREVVMVECHCPRRPGGLRKDRFGFPYSDFDGIVSHECPRRGAEIVR
jgi:hypothetical protein